MNNGNFYLLTRSTPAPRPTTMPRPPKRRSDAISRDDPEDSDSDDRPQRSTQTQQRRRRQASTPASQDHSASNDEDNENASGSDTPGATTQTNLHNLSKKLVRLAISSEYARQPLRRTDINVKIMKDATSAGTKIPFRNVFNDAQKTLRDIFGMELVDLPSRERTDINNRRNKAVRQKAATQAATQRNTQRDMDTQTTATQRARDPIAAAQSWILVSCLPTRYRVHPDIFTPARAPNEPTESTYTALYTMIVSIVYLHTPTAGPYDSNGNGSHEDTTEPISDAKLMRHLSRLQLDTWAPMNGPGGSELSVEKLLQRMVKEGYLDKRKDTSSGEEVVEWTVGPRGKREIGRKGVAALVRGVYGFGVDGKGSGLQMPRDDESDEDVVGDAQEQNAGNQPLKMERDELERRLKRTLGEVVTLKIDEREGVNGAEE